MLRRGAFISYYIYNISSWFIMFGEKQIYVYFAFVGEDFAPKALGERLGLEATESWQRGQAEGRRISPRFSYWKLAVVGKDVRLLLADLLGRLSGKEAEIVALKSELQADSILKVVVEDAASAGAAAMILDSAAIAFLHRTDTTVDIRVEQPQQSLAS